MLLKNVLNRSEMISCVLCHEAPCCEACQKMDPAKALLGIWLDNQDVAALALPTGNPCVRCSQKEYYLDKISANKNGNSSEFMPMKVLLEQRLLNEMNSYE